LYEKLFRENWLENFSFFRRIFDRFLSQNHTIFSTILFLNQMHFEA
jgi:hypothetical protein